MSGTARDNTTFWRALSALVLIGLVAGFAIGCSQTTPRNSAAEPAAEQGAMQASADAEKKPMEPASESMESDADSQGCSACTTGKEPEPVEGSAEMVDGVQVVTVKIVDGYFTPNRFTVKAGVPVKAVFKVEGKRAKACVSKPTFKALGKTVTVNEGEKAIELGVLAPGVHEFSCAMGGNKGSITVQ